MTALVFLGPSLPLQQAKQISDALHLPPAAQGDVYRAVKQYKPRVVAIVDGYFRQLPSVWHKEILWAMDQGVHVVGGASMGALRAAELSHFGMEGIGNIFLAYRCGRFEPFDTDFEDDDEVAVVHGPAEVGYVSASVAMVNIRATLAQASYEGIIRENTRDRLAIAEAERRGLQVSDSALREYRATWRQTMGLFDGGSFLSWLESNDLDQTGLDRLLEEDLKLFTLLCDTNLHPDAEILEELKLAGDYAALSAQAARHIPSTQTKAESLPDPLTPILCRGGEGDCKKAVTDENTDLHRGSGCL